MKTRLLGGIAALVLAIVGTVLLLAYVQGADARAQSSLDPVKVLIATRDVPAGTPVAELTTAFKEQSLPAVAVPKDALNTLADQDGKVLAQAVTTGEQLLAAKLVTADSLLTPGTVDVPEGKQEVTVLLEPERVAGGNLRAGDTVGVFGSFTVKDKNDKDAEEVEITKLLDEKVLVTAIQIAAGQTEGTAEGAAALPAGSAYVTFGVDSAQGAKIIHTREFGLVWLTKQNEDTAKGDSRVWEINQVLK